MGLKARPRGYDEAVADRIRLALGPRSDVVEKHMFGGLAFMLRGHMAVGVVKDELMVRVGADAYIEALTQPHARPMDFTGKPLRGFVYVDRDAAADPKLVAEWVARGVAYAESLPSK